MRTSILAAALLAAVAPALAADNRQLYTHAKSDPTTFCNTWRCACINYVPTDSSLYFFSAICQPGDYQGKNNQTEALASCSFTADGHASVIESAAIAKKVNATLA